jgi:YesN/AraC family two-component response regulator
LCPGADYTGLRREFLSERTVLIVEDEAINALYLKIQLKQMGYSVCGTAANAPKAIEAAQTHKPWVILTDIRLSGDLTGIDAIREIQKELSPYVVFMSGYDLSEFAGELDSLKPLGFLKKPVKLSLLKDYLDMAE